MGGDSKQFHSPTGRNKGMPTAPTAPFVHASQGSWRRWQRKHRRRPLCVLADRISPGLQPGWCVTSPLGIGGMGRYSSQSGATDPGDGHKPSWKSNHAPNRSPTLTGVVLRGRVCMCACWADPGVGCGKQCWTAGPRHVTPPCTCLISSQVGMNQSGYIARTSRSEAEQFAQPSPISI